MALLVQNIPFGLDEPEEALADAVAKRLRVPADSIRRMAAVRRSLDARKKNDIHFV